MFILADAAEPHRAVRPIGARGRGESDADLLFFSPFDRVRQLRLKGPPAGTFAVAAPEISVAAWMAGWPFF
jgi:hypothetical protein